MVKSGKPHFEPQSRAAVEAALVSLGIKVEKVALRSLLLLYDTNHLFPSVGA